MSRESVWVIHSLPDWVQKEPYPIAFLHAFPGRAVRTKKEALWLAICDEEVRRKLQMHYEIVDDQTENGGFWIIIKTWLREESQCSWKVIEEIPIDTLYREETQTGTKSADPCVEEG